MASTPWVLAIEEPPGARSRPPTGISSSDAADVPILSSCAKTLPVPNTIATQMSIVRYPYNTFFIVKCPFAIDSMNALCIALLEGPFAVRVPNLLLLNDRDLHDFRGDLARRKR